MLGMLAGILAVVEVAARMMGVAARRMAEVHAAADTALHGAATVHLRTALYGAAALH